MGADGGGHGLAKKQEHQKKVLKSPSVKSKPFLCLHDNFISER
jgi:hypothetical protein